MRRDPSKLSQSVICESDVDAKEFELFYSGSFAYFGFPCNGTKCISTVSKPKCCKKFNDESLLKA